MKTSLFSKYLRLGCLVGTSALAVQLGHAQAPATGLTLQLTAETGVAAPGGNVTTWTDQVTTDGATDVLTSSGSGQTLTTESFGNGTHSVVTFDGTLNNLATAAPVPFTDLVADNQGAIFMVLRQQGTAFIGETPFGWGGGPDRLFAQTRWDQAPTGIHFQYGNPGTGGQLVAGTLFPEDSSWHILSMIRNGGNGEIRLDGVPIATTSGFTTVVSGNQTLTVGGSDLTTLGFQDPFKGAIAEILTYNIGTVDANAVETYLGGKYGLAPVPEPSQYAVVFGLACVAGALLLRNRRQQLA